MKPPNLDGKNQITTDMEIITTEILNHRIMGRFAERVQYLRRKQTVPIDAPKTIRGLFSNDFVSLKYPSKISGWKT